MMGVGCLEGCGLGWRVRPPLSRRSPWTVVAQRVRLCVEAAGGCSLEKLYTVLEHSEVSPRVSFEVALRDLHPGDIFHLPVRVSLPALDGAATCAEVVRFSLAYVDAGTIDTKTCAIGASVARPQVRPLHSCDRRVTLLHQARTRRIMLSGAPAWRSDALATPSPYATHSRH